MTQQTYFPIETRKGPHMLGASVINTCALDKALESAASEQSRVNALVRSGAMYVPKSGRIDSVPSQAGSILAWYATDGKHGWRAIHMLRDEIVLEYAEHEDCDMDTLEHVVNVLATHPDPERRANWQAHQRRLFPSVNDAVSALEGLSAEQLAAVLEQLQAQPSA